MFRDCEEWADVGLHLSTTSDECARLFDNALNQYVTWIEAPDMGGLEGTLEKMTEADPDMMMGKVLSLGLDLMATVTTPRLDSEFAARVAAVEGMSQSSSLTTREKLHCSAVSAFARENHAHACELWEQILLRHPYDMLALKFAHDAYFYKGNSVMIRDSVGRVLPAWDAQDRHCGYLHGMYAFGLEETNLYALAQKHANMALQANPTDCWATHARAHCHEMQGETNEGIAFMRSTESDWKQGGMLACHNYWHWALYHIEKNDHQSAIGIYDQEVGIRMKSGAALDLVDAASLLYRLELEGVNVGSERWEDLFEVCRPRLDDHIMVFNDAHFLMAYLGAKKPDYAQKFITSVERYVTDNVGDNVTLNRRVGVPLYKAMVACHEKRYADAVELLYPMKNNIVHIGGSNAQRDVFQQLLVHAAAHSNKNFARSLLYERKSLKEKSPLTDRLIGKFITTHTE